MFLKVFSYFNRLPFGSAFKYALLQFCRKYVNSNIKLSFSEFGEDVLIQSSLNYKSDGFFVDVGCNHPIINSTTFALYLQGWQGVNIDGNEALIKKCKAIRKNDISINALISNEEKNVEYIKFSNNALNSINKDVIEEWNKSMVISSEHRKTYTLTTILKDLFPAGKKIDLLTIDVEGHDYEVLCSLDLQLFPPSFIVIEMKGFKLNQEHPIANYLFSQNYEMIYYSGLNGYFKKL